MKTRTGKKAKIDAIDRALDIFEEDGVEFVILNGARTPVNTLMTAEIIPAGDVKAEKETPEEKVAKSIASQEATIKEAEAEAKKKAEQMQKGIANPSRTPVNDKMKAELNKPADGLRYIEGEVLKISDPHGLNMYFLKIAGFELGDLSEFGSVPDGIIEGCIVKIGYTETPSKKAEGKVYYNIKTITKTKDAPDDATNVVGAAVKTATIVDPIGYGLPEKGEQQTPNESLEIIPSGGFLSPACTIQEAVDVFKVFEQAKTQILDPKKDVIWIGKYGKPTEPGGDSHPHIKRSGWRKLARFFGLSWKIVDRQKIPTEDGYMWVVAARVTHPMGSVVEQDGAASSNDPFFTKGGRTKANEEDVLMKAETVALNRTISDMLGSGECSAEEID